MLTPRNVLRLFAAALLAMVSWGCTYHAPFAPRLSDERRAQMIEVERCCRSYGARVWDGYLHSADT